MVTIENSFHLSNLIGIRWDTFKEILKKPSFFYSSFFLYQKSGKKRFITAPNLELAICQKYIFENILELIPISEHAHGFKKGRSIITNANVHLNSDWAINIDIKDFFKSIKSNRIFYLFNSICKYNKNISYLLTKLVSYNGRLPEGACTSPIIANILTFKIDQRISAFAEKNNLKYSRYADDITISGDINSIGVNLVLRILEEIIVNEGFIINSSKTRVFKNNLKVTGLVISNSEIKVSSSYIKDICIQLYFIKKYGLESHFQYLFKNTGRQKELYIIEIISKIIWIRNINLGQYNYIMSQYSLVIIELNGIIGFDNI